MNIAEKVALLNHNKVKAVATVRSGAGEDDWQAIDLMEIINSLLLSDTTYRKASSDMRHFIDEHDIEQKMGQPVWEAIMAAYVKRIHQ